MHIVRNAARMIAALALLGAAAPAAADSKAAETAVRAGEAAWARAWNAGDADAIVMLYAKYGLVMAPGAPPARGQAAIREFLVKDIAGGQKAGVTLTIAKGDEVVVSGKLAVHTGTWSVSDKSGAVVDGGSYVDIWREAGGRWVIAQDIWNSDRAPSPPSAAVK
jgi:uncharacterized protein (TIGR02246 family)